MNGTVLVNNALALDSKNANILLVDDEEANIKLLERTLHSAGYQNIISTQDSRQALPLLRTHNCDLLLLDLNMPHLDGYGVMEQIKAQFSLEEYPAILVLTAQSMQDSRQRALDNGARDYVTKPFNIQELLSRVRNLLEVHCAQKFIRNQNYLLEEMVEARTRDLQTAHQKLRESRLQVVRRLGRAAEYRDNETGLHIIRMSKIATLLGQSAGMNETEAHLLLNASPMHDIGKIGIPDHILLKPGKLDPEEWEIMKTHAQIGANILAEDDSELLCMAREIALTHHEKWDGSGYPNGLQGDDIPLVGRVTALADVFDALTSQRPYKKAWSNEDAVALIMSESGKHFDPMLITHFHKLLPEIFQIRDQYAEPEVSQIG